MANAEQLEILKQGVDVWNAWRRNNPTQGIYLQEADLSGSDLTGINFSYANLCEATLHRTVLTDAKLREGYFHGANFQGVDMVRGDLTGGQFQNAHFEGATLSYSNLYRACFNGAFLKGASLRGTYCHKTSFLNTDLTEASLVHASLIEGNVEQAILVKCKIYGLSTWDIIGKPKIQADLTITHPLQATVTVDDLQMAQFIHCLLNNDNIRSAIDTITSKVILILGRFTEERKVVLDSIRDELRSMNLTPILFDFEKPASKDLTGTVSTLANMARFIIADITDPSSIPHELASIIPSLRTTPVLPLRLKGSTGYSMFEDFQRDLPHRVLPTHEYQDGPSLIAELSEVIKPANDLAEGFRGRRA